MKKNLFDYFNSSQEIKLETQTQEKDMLEKDSSDKKPIQKENQTNTPTKTQIEVSIDSSVLSEIDKDWPSDEVPNNVKKVKKEEKAPASLVIPPTKTKKPQEDRYGFLVDIKDKYGRSIHEEDYDSSTLLITEEQLSTLTPFEKQFWEIKKEYFDTIVFFKKGKFYELYEEDADISAKLFNMKITERVNMRMTGFPESSYDEWACKFLEAGYKIARVEQSENAIGKQIREKGGKKDKIINRELKEVITQGTIYDMNHIKTTHSTFLCAIRRNVGCKNIENCKTDSSDTHFSIVLYDASTSTIHSSTFCDDQFFTSLRGYFCKYPIMEYLSDRKFDFGSLWIKPDKKNVVSEVKFRLNEEEYECYCMIHNYLSYLKREDGLKNVKIEALEDAKGFMILETSTIVNMELFDTKENKKSLFTTINNCSTPGGERTLRNWLLHPLFNYSDIKQRQRVSKLMESLVLDSLISELSSLGDPERLLSKLSKGRVSLKDLNGYLEMMKKAIKIYNELESVLSANKKELLEIKCFRDIGEYDLSQNRPVVRFNIKIELENKLNEFLKNYKISKDEILPDKSNKDELNFLLKDKEKIEEEFIEYLDKQKSILNCENLTYKSIGKEIYQIDVPKEIKTVPDDWYLVSTTKSTNRYYTKEITKMVRGYVEIGERIFQSQGCLLNRAIEDLLQNIGLFETVTRDLNYCDCLISFSIFNGRNECCLPKEGKELVFKGLRNPIYTNYIQNDYVEENRIIVLTGSNMSGKSTFMRSLTLNIILFQMGMGVCATQFTSPLFDRLFTRIGASDNLGRGESTFMVELSEMSTVLRYATDKSFVLVDELGRGTSVNDGKSIAKAVVQKLKSIQCRVIFSTHYHHLIKDVSLFYMDSKIINNDLIFLYKLKKGECEDSNGIYVAKLAGVPSEIVDKAWSYRNDLLQGQRK